MSKKSQVLAEYLEVEESEVLKSYWDNDTFEYGSEEYLVLTDSEADERVTNYIKDSVWAFVPSFIASHSKIDYDATITLVEAIQEKCEDSNDAILSLIEDFEDFVNDAINADGRGHFLNNWDGEEVEQGEFYIYRTN